MARTHIEADREKVSAQSENGKGRNKEKPMEGPKWTDVAIVILTLGILAAAGLQTYIFHRQRQEMTDSGKQTDRIIEADNRLAAANERFAAAMEASNTQAQIALDKTVKENKKALAATLTQAQKALDASISAAQSEQRAYVTIGKPDGTVADIIWPKEESGNAGLMVYFQNNGRLPARFNWGSNSTIVDSVPTDPKITKWGVDASWTDLPTNHLFHPMTRMKSRDGKNVQWSGTVDIAGGSSFQGLLWEIPKERMLQLMNFEEKIFITSGRFEYCDGFGSRVCKNFALTYAREPYNRFFLAMEGECSDLEMQTKPVPDYTYLPVCEISRPELRTTIPSFPQPK